MDISEFIKDNIICISVITAILGILIIYWISRMFRRITKVDSLPYECRGIKLRGVYTHVVSGNNFRFYHVPPFRCIGNDVKRAETMTVRLYGIDAPKSSYMGYMSQPLFFESKCTLQKILDRQWVTLKILKVDRFSRIVAKAYVGWLFKKDVSLKMLELGMACVYQGEEEMLGGNGTRLFEKEKIAKNRKVGIWGLQNFEPPRDFKNRMSGIRADVS